MTDTFFYCFPRPVISTPPFVVHGMEHRRPVISTPGFVVYGMEHPGSVISTPPFVVYGMEQRRRDLKWHGACGSHAQETGCRAQLSLPWSRQGPTRALEVISCPCRSSASCKLRSLQPLGRALELDWCCRDDRYFLLLFPRSCHLDASVRCLWHGAPASCHLDATVRCLWYGAPRFRHLDATVRCLWYGAPAERSQVAQSVRQPRARDRV